MSDEEEEFEGLYENGEWKWDDSIGGLVFVSNLKPTEIDVAPSGPIIGGAIEFREDMDVLEQQRFRKLFSRRFVPDDVIVLQDMKDLTLYSAPKALLTPVLINILHQPQADRFLRALLLYCQYYIQISDTMNKRVEELSEKVRTEQCQLIEDEFRENLEDLRLLVAKEYSGILLGFEGMSKYHHMGPSRKMRSLSKYDALLYETLVRFSIQIVWLALGRKAFNLIELEVHRLFKSSIFNIAEHNLHVNFESKMNETTSSVLFGKSVIHKRKLNTNSPLNNALNCTSRNIDYRLLGLGTIKFHGLDDRQRFFENALTLHESQIQNKNMSIGILGLKRSGFDTMLREVKGGSASSSATSIKQSSAKMGSMSKTSKTRVSTKSKMIPQRLYPEIEIPEASYKQDALEDVFPDELLPRVHINEVQRKRWINFIIRIHATIKKRRSKNFIK